MLFRQAISLLALVALVLSSAPAARAARVKRTRANKAGVRAQRGTPSRPRSQRAPRNTKRLLRGPATAPIPGAKGKEKASILAPTKKRKGKVAAKTKRKIKKVSKAGEAAIAARIKARAISKGRQRRAISGVVQFLSRKARNFSKRKGNAKFVDFASTEAVANSFEIEVTDDILDFPDEEATWDFEDMEISFDADPNVYAIDHPMMEKGIIDVWVQARPKKGISIVKRIKLALSSSFNARYTVTFRSGGSPVVVEHAGSSLGARLIRGANRLLPIRAIISDISSSRSSKQGVLAGLLGLVSMEPTTAILGIGVMVTTLRLQAEKREAKQKTAITKTAEQVARHYKERNKFPSLVATYNRYKRIIQTPASDGSAMPKPMSIREFSTRLGGSEALPFPNKAPAPKKRRRIGF